MSITHVEVLSSDSECDATDGDAPPLKIVKTRHSHLAAASMGISGKEFRRMKRWRAPNLFFQVLLLLHQITGWLPMRHDGAEWFSGVSAVQESLVEDSLLAFAYDWTRGNHMDFTSPLGFAFAASRSKELKPGSTSHWDTVCSSFVWMAQKHCRRTITDILGDERCWATKSGNLMVVRMVLLSLYHLSKFAVFLLEQPSSSVMRNHPHFEYLEYAAKDLKLLTNEPVPDPSLEGITDVPTWMGSFGGPTPKRSVLSCSHPDVVLPLHRTLSKADKARLAGESVVTDEYVMESGRLKHKVTGKRRKLKQTQIYPRGYGKAVSLSYRQWLRGFEKRHNLHDDSSDSDYCADLPDWPEAELTSVIKLLLRKRPNCRRAF